MRIGTVDIPSQLVLAPMAGVTDLAFRLICRELGAGLTVTEMVSAKALCYQDKKSRGLLKLSKLPKVLPTKGEAQMDMPSKGGRSLYNRLYRIERLPT